MGGALLLNGIVTSRVEIDQAGFYGAHVEVKESGQGGHSTVTLVIKNEVMCVKRGDRPLVMFPDLVYILDPVTGEGLMSTELQEGCAVAIVAAPCSPVVREALSSELGRIAFSPTRYGETADFTPIEDLRTKDVR